MRNFQHVHIDSTNSMWLFLTTLNCNNAHLLSTASSSPMPSTQQSTIVISNNAHRLLQWCRRHHCHWNYSFHPNYGRFQQKLPMASNINCYCVTSSASRCISNGCLLGIIGIALTKNGQPQISSPTMTALSNCIWTASQCRNAFPCCQNATLQQHWNMLQFPKSYCLSLNWATPDKLGSIKMSPNPKFSSMNCVMFSSAHWEAQWNSIVSQIATIHSPLSQPQPCPKYALLPE